MVATKTAVLETAAEAYTGPSALYSHWWHCSNVGIASNAAWWMDSTEGITEKGSGRKWVRESGLV